MANVSEDALRKLAEDAFAKWKYEVGNKIKRPVPKEDKPPVQSGPPIMVNCQRPPYRFPR